MNAAVVVVHDNNPVGGERSPSRFGFILHLPNKECSPAVKPSEVVVGHQQPMLRAHNKNPVAPGLHGSHGRIKMTPTKHRRRH